MRQILIFVIYSLIFLIKKPSFSSELLLMHEKTTRQLTQRVIKELEYDLFVDSNNMGANYLTVIQNIHHGFFENYVYPKCFGDDKKFEEQLRLLPYLKDLKFFIKPCLKIESPLISLEKITPRLKHLIRRCENILRKDPFTSYVLGRLMFEHLEDEIKSLGKELLYTTAEFYTPNRTLYYLTLEKLFYAQDPIAIDTVRNLSMNYLLPRQPRLNDSFQMRYIQLLLSSPQHFDFTCDLIEETVSHCDIKKLQPEYVWEITSTLLSKNYQSRIRPGLLNVFYRYANFPYLGFLENNEISPGKFNKLPSEDPGFYTVEFPLSKFAYNKGFSKIFKDKILNILAQVPTSFDIPEISRLVYELELMLDEKQGRLNRTLTFVATDETRGDGINPDTMDYFNGTKYPWLTYAVPALSRRFKKVEVVSWQDSDIDWNSKNLIVIGPVWGYTKVREKFKIWLEKLKATGKPVLNDPSFILWNINKNYLRELDPATLIPSIFVQPETQFDLKEIFKKFKTDEIVIKGIIDAGAFGLIKISPQELEKGIHHIIKLQKENGGAIIQPYMDTSQGEISIIFNGPIASHCALKVPAKEDFRTQSFYNAKTFFFPMHTFHDPFNRLYLPSKGLSSDSPAQIIEKLKKNNKDFCLKESDIITAVKSSYIIRQQIKNILSLKGIYPPLFLRIDILPCPDRKLRIMEIEGIEPYTMVQEADLIDLDVDYSLHKIFQPQKAHNYTQMIWNWSLEHVAGDIYDIINE